MKQPNTIYRQSSELPVSYDTISGERLWGLSQSELKALLLERAKLVAESKFYQVETDQLVNIVAVLNALATRQHGAAFFQCPLRV